MVPRDQPNSSCSGSMSTPGRRRGSRPRRPAPRRPRRPPTRRGGSGVGVGGRAAPRSCVTQSSCAIRPGRRTSGRRATMCKNPAMRCRASGRRARARRRRRVRPRACRSRCFGAARDDDGGRSTRSGRTPDGAAGAHVGRLPGAARARPGDPGRGRHGDRARHPRRRRSDAPAGSRTPRRAALARSGRGARLMSICTGAFVLAAAGLLDGRPGHHALGCADAVPAAVPAGQLDPDVLFVDDGDVLTSAGVAAGHRPVPAPGARATTAAEVANRAARRCVVPPWRDGGQAQFIERVRAGVAGHARPRRPARGRWTAWTSRSISPTWPRRRDERAHLHPPVPRRDRA